MEKEHLIIIAILAVILYMCMNKSEKFYGPTEEDRQRGANFAQNIRYQDASGKVPYTSFAQNIRYQDCGGKPCGEAFAQRIHRNDMNIFGSQYIKGHIRNDRRNNMMSSMMYGDPRDCGENGCA